MLQVNKTYRHVVTGQVSKVIKDGPNYNQGKNVTLYDEENFTTVVSSEEWKNWKLVCETCHAPISTDDPVVTQCWECQEMRGNL